VQKQLKKALASKHPEKFIEKFVTFALSRYINPENLENAINDNADILTLALNHHHLSSPIVFPFFKILLRLHWETFEALLVDVPYLYKVLCRKQGVQELLDTERGRKYINWAAETSYFKLYYLIWLS